VPAHIYATLTPVGDDPAPRDYDALLLQSMGQGFHTTTAVPALADARDHLVAEMRFQPATIGACAVPALTVQEFRMVITQPGDAHN
jgi:hypothetical protein